MTISVIIPTFNGASRILNVLQALENQSIQDFEVIVAIDGSTDDTRELLKKQVFSFKAFKVIEQANKGRAAIRNFGASKATGELLVFYDDDMRPNINSVEKHLIFQGDHRNCICGGNQLEEDLMCKTDIQKYKRYLSLKWTAKYYEGLNKLNKQNLFLSAANFSIPKSLFERLGGFDERLTDAEDFELGLRALEQGYDVYFDKGNVSWHDDFITCKSYILRQRQYARANEMLRKYMPVHYFRKSLDMDLLPWYKKFIFSFFGKPFFATLIDKECLKWLPMKVRYKIYNYTITALGRIYTSTII